MFRWKRFVESFCSNWAKPGGGTSRRRPKVRLFVEQLESRVVPSTINYTSSASTYQQTFGTLPDSGGAATIVDGDGSPKEGPYDLTRPSPDGFGASGLTGWTSINLVSGAEKFGQGEPSTTTGALYDFNDGTAGSQSLGTISTSGTASRFGAIFTNSTGQTLTAFSLSYTGEEWWDNRGSGNSLTFSYALGVASLPTGNQGTSVTSLGFTAPDSSLSGVYKDANANPSYQVAVFGTVSGINWAPGTTLAIYWDKGAGAADSAGLGIANLSFAASATPVVISSTDNLPTNASSMTIAGSGFDTTAAHDSVTFNNGVAGTVSSVNASGTIMTVSSLSGLSSLSVGTVLTASVTIDGAGGGAAVQVATLAAPSTPTITSSSDNLPENATSMTIAGTAFDTTAANDVVTFSNGATGTASSATTTLLTVTNLAGLSLVSTGTALDACVSVDGINSGSALQVATIAASSTPTVQSSSSNLSDEATSITINGTGFDTTPANDMVAFNDGVIGTVSSVNGAGTSMTVNVSGLSSNEIGTVLDAAVTTDGDSSGNPVEVATIGSQTISYGTPGSSYAQNFSSLPTGSASLVIDAAGAGPFDLTAGAPVGFGASGLSGWYSVNIGTNASQNLVIGEPYTTTGAIFDFNDRSAGSQALGTISTPTNDQRFGTIFVNNTGQTLSEFQLSYTGEEWWDNNGTGKTLNFGYELGVANLPTGSGTQVPYLGFTAPNSSRSGVDEDAYTNSMFQVPVSGEVQGISWSPGETLAIFWDKGAGDSQSDGLGIANFTFQATGNATTPTVSVTDSGGTYNGQPYAATNAGVTYNGTTIATFGSPTLSYQYYQGSTLLPSAPIAAGSYTVVANYTSDNPNYPNASSSAVAFTISPEAITIAADNQSTPYGTALNLGSTAFTVNSGTVQPGDSITGVALTVTDPNLVGQSGSGNDSAGVWGIAASAATGTGGFNTTNYNISYSPGLLTITPTALSVTGVSSTNQTYNGTTSDALTGTPVLSGAVSGDNVSLAGTGVGTLASEDAGSEAVTLSGYSIIGSDAQDYILSEPTLSSVSISPEAIDIIANNQNQTYGSVNLGTSAFTVASGAVQTGDSISGVTLSVVDTNSLGTSGSGNYDAGTWGISPSAAVGTGGFNTINYSISYVAGPLTITPLPLTITGLAGSSQTYDGTISDALTGTPVLSGNIAGDDVTLTGTGIGTLAGVNAGSEAVTVSGYGITGSDAGDYSFSEPTLSPVTIGPEAITIAANNQTQTYGSVNLGTSAFTVGSGAVQTGDSISGVTLSLTDINSLGTSGSGNDDVGIWGITPSAASGAGGFDTTNYDITYASATLTINPLALTVTGISGTNKTYDGTTNDPLTGTPILSGNIAGDNVTLTGTGVGTLANPQTGTEPITISGYGDAGSDAHDYNLSEPTVPAVTVFKATPAITWANPADIKPNTKLSSTQLHANANTAGTFVYLPASGTILPQGLFQTLSATFTPSDTTDYNSATDSVPINVWPISVKPAGTSVKANASQLTISGYGFSTTPSNDIVTLSGGATATVTAATTTALTVSVSNLASGPLMASVINTALTVTATSHGIPNNTTPIEQIGIVAPIVTTSTATLSANSTSLVINGFGFSTTTADDVVTFSNGVTGTVVSATNTQLSVSVSNLPAGALKASITVNGTSSGTAVEVASVAPVVTMSAANLLANATTLTIYGYGFTTGTTVKLTGGTAGTATVVSANQLNLTVKSLTAGPLTAVVVSASVSSGMPVQVATVIPLITNSAGTITATATSLTLNGFGFSTTAANDVVTLMFDDGSTATIPASTATATRLTLKLTGTHPKGPVYAYVTVNGLYTSSTVEVAVVN